MQIKCFPLGAMWTNCYLVYDEITKEAYFFDCGGKNIENLNEYIEKNNLDLKHIILTHGHGDHIEGLNILAETYPKAKIYIGKEEKDFLFDSNLSLSDRIFGEKFTFNKGEVIEVVEGNFIGNFKTIDTPGHTIGSKSFYNQKDGILIAGDTMFRRSYGRYDLPTGDEDTLYRSLNKLCSLPENTVVYSGHTDPTTIAEEKLFLKRVGIL